MIKTPLNPSKKATKRVNNPLPVPTACNCCSDWETGESSSGCIDLVENKEIYGRNYGQWPWAYLCENCGAYVGLHPFTNIPLGTLADKSMREARKGCKPAFDRLHETGLMSRGQAYQRLAEKLGIDKNECHFGWFDIDMCARAKAASFQIALEA